MLGCPWYAELPQEGTGVAARPFTAVPAVHASDSQANFMHMTATPGSKSIRSLINDHKIMIRELSEECVERHGVEAPARAHVVSDFDPHRSRQRTLDAVLHH